MGVTETEQAIIANVKTTLSTDFNIEDLSTNRKAKGVPLLAVNLINVEPQPDLKQAPPKRLMTLELVSALTNSSKTELNNKFIEFKNIIFDKIGENAVGINIGILAGSLLVNDVEFDFDYEIAENRTTFEMVATLIIRYRGE